MMDEEKATNLDNESEEVLDGKNATNMDAPDCSFDNAKPPVVDTNEAAASSSEAGVSAPSEEEQIASSDIAQEQMHDVTTLTQENKKKGLSKGAIAGIVAGAIVVIIAIVIGVVLHMQAQATEKYNEYIDNLESLSSSGLQAASIAEDLCNTTKKVWNSAIWDDDKKWDSEIEKYHASDFNDALSKLYADSSTKTMISNMKSYASDVEDLMDKLKNPPDPDLEDAYDAAKEFADTVEEMVDLAASPSGSLQTYSSNFSSADDACAKALKNLTREIPEQKE